MLTLAASRTTQIVVKGIETDYHSCMEESIMSASADQTQEIKEEVKTE